MTPLKKINHELNSPATESGNIGRSDINAV